MNRLLLGGPLYEEERFSHVILKSDLRQLIASNPHDTELLRLNRLLLEAAYPSAIAKSRRPYELVVQPVSGSRGRHNKFLNSLPDDVTIVYKIHGSFPKDEAGKKDKRARAKKGGKIPNLIITEEDYIKFLTVVSKQEGGIPSRIKGAMVQIN